MKIRAARPEDVEAMVALSDRFRNELSHYSPVFWRMAGDANEKQTAWFRILLASAKTIAMVAESDIGIAGFVIANLQDAPPVYAPGGPVCLIDDYCVDDDWSGAGADLLDAVEAEARERGAVLSVVVCPHLATEKRGILADRGFAVTAEWHVREL